VIPVNPAKHPAINNKGAMALVDWITAPEGQEAMVALKL
jgi:tungstate transport system substrate-binding protein